MWLEATTLYVLGTALQAETPLAVFESEGGAPGFSKYWLPASSQLAKLE